MFTLYSSNQSPDQHYDVETIIIPQNEEVKV